MNEWFTIEKIDDDTFALSEYKHWEETHSYLLLGKKRALIIDSGLGVDNIKCAVKKITALPVTVSPPTSIGTISAGTPYLTMWRFSERKKAG